MLNVKNIEGNNLPEKEEKEMMELFNLETIPEVKVDMGLNIKLPRLEGELLGTTKDDTFVATSEGITNGLINALQGDDTIIGIGRGKSHGYGIQGFFKEKTIDGGNGHDRITGIASGESSATVSMEALSMAEMAMTESLVLPGEEATATVSMEALSMVEMAMTESLVLPGEEATATVSMEALSMAEMAMTESLVLPGEEATATVSMEALSMAEMAMTESLVLPVEKASPRASITALSMAEMAMT
jgi:hypothetical protein